MVRTVLLCTRMPVRLYRPRVMAIKAVSRGHHRPSAGAPVRREAKVRIRASMLSLVHSHPHGCASPPFGTRFALAAHKGDANKRDHWVVDEHRGTCTRIHQRFRTCLYVPHPEHCPVPFWRLKGNVEVRMYNSEGSCDFTEKTYNFRTLDRSEPMDRWIGITTFYLKPKVMKVQFQRPEIIDIAPEGEGWRFVVGKRKYDRRYKTTDDCPLSDPDDSNDAP